MVRDGSNKLRDDYIWTIEIKLKHKAETIEIDSPDTEKLYIYIYIFGNSNPIHKQQEVPNVVAK